MAARGLRRLGSRADLETLSRWLLDTNRPSALRVVGHLRSNILGKLRNEVIVNSWPRPSVVVLKPLPASSPGYVNNVCSVFAINKTDCQETLADPRVLDWEKPWGIGGLDTQLTGVISELAEDYGGHLQGHSGPCNLLHISEEKIRKYKAPLPLGYYPSQLKESHISLITSTWPYREDDTDYFLSYLLRHLPSACVRIAGTGQLVGWTVTQHYRCVGMMHIMPEHRNKGIGQYLTKVNALDIIKEGSPVYTYVIKGNSSPIRMLKKMGFEMADDYDAEWVTYNPPEQQMRIISSG